MSSASPRTGLLLDEIYIGHDPGPGHPESPARYTAIMKAFRSAGLVEKMRPISQRPALFEELERCHVRGYIETAQLDVASGAETLRTGDTHVCTSSFDVALRAAGGVMNAVDAVMTGKVGKAFCAVRPPGHHARPAQGMGFWLFNNIAIGARHAQKKHGAEKVLIVDWDVHHGNGTQDIFYEDGSVLFFSSHQSPWYPFTGYAEETGAGKGKHCTINAPFPAGAGMKEISGAFFDRLLPAADKFKPDLVMISAGFDSREHDPLGHFTLTDENFATLTHELMNFADAHCEGRLVSVLEGGYRLSGLAKAATAHVTALLNPAS